MKQLTELPARLPAVMGRGDDNQTARAAKRLAIVTRQVSVDPLPDIKILAYTGEMEKRKADCPVLNSSLPFRLQLSTFHPPLAWRTRVCDNRVECCPK